MRILLLTQLFQPEPNLLKGLAFAREMQRRGHRVQVLTGFPNYPGGRFYDGCRPRPLARDTLDGVEVLRVLHYPSHDRSGLRRVGSYASFALSAAVLGAPAIARPDVIHVYQGPATLMIPAVAIAALRGGRIVLDIQDLWPESVTGSGMMRSHTAPALLDRFCRWTYRRARRIVVLSPGYKQRLVDRGVDPGRIEVVYNWSDESAQVPAARPEGATGDLLPTGTFNIVYAGSLGPLQGLDAVLDAASLVHGARPDVRFVLVGGGIDADDLRARAGAAGVRNVMFVPRQTPQDALRMQLQADALLIHLKENELSDVAIPQKVQAYLAAGRPILAGVNGDAGGLIEQAGAGVRCRPGDPADIARAAIALAALSGEARNEMGRRGRRFYEHHLGFAHGCDTMEAVFAAAASGKTS